MSGRIRNPAQRCKICGAQCSKRMRYCVACAIQRKAARIGIDSRKVHVGVVLPPLSTGGYLCELLPEVKRFTAPSGG